MIVWGIDPGSATGAVVAYQLTSEQYNNDLPGSILDAFNLPIIKERKMSRIDRGALVQKLNNLPTPRAIYLEEVVPRGIFAKMMIGVGNLQMLDMVYGVPLHTIPVNEWQQFYQFERGDPDNSLKDQARSWMPYVITNESYLGRRRKEQEHRIDAVLIARYGAFIEFEEMGNGL